MNTYGSKHLAASFRTVRNNTIQVAEDIPETQYSYIPVDGTRSVAQTLAHVATTPMIWSELHGDKAVTNLDEFDFFGILGRLETLEKQPRTKAEILDLLRTEGEKFASFLEGVSEEKLAQETYGPAGQPAKSRFESLLSAKEHEMHHRAQLMLVQRLLGIVPHLTRQREQFRRDYEEKMKAQTVS